MPDADSDAPDHNPTPNEVIDWEAFDFLLDVTEARAEPEAMRELLQIYRTDVARTLAHLTPLGPEDHVESRSWLHKIKGASGSLAFTGAVNAIKRLHDPLESPPTEQRQKLLWEIRDAVEQCLAFVEARHPWLNAD